MAAKEQSQLMEGNDNFNRVKIENEYALREAKERTEEAVEAQKHQQGFERAGRQSPG